MMIRLTLDGGLPLYVAPRAVSSVVTETDGGTAVVMVGSERFGVHEPAEVVVRLIESAARPAADADYAPLVDAAKRLVAFLRDSDNVVSGYAPVAHALAAALAALPDAEVSRG
ncbi:hypothetical protein LLG88_12005 [bacterium]|nr:hypothetical protein [bacterium]